LNPWLGSLKLKQKAKKIIHMTWWSFLTIHKITK
jgi:hypothetical protein